MSKRNRLALAAALALAVIFAFVLAQSILRRADSTESYPFYSSLNNGEKGTKAYFEALGRLGLAPSRNYKMLGKLTGRRAAVFYAGPSLPAFRYSGEKELEEFDKLASRGARVLLLFDPEAVISLDEPKPPPTDPAPVDNLKKRWGIELSYTERRVPDASREMLSRLNMLPVDWRFSNWPKAWTASFLRNGSPLFLERAFGAGAIVLIRDSRPFTNRELLVHPDAEVLSAAPGAFRDIVFDESHLGLADTGTVIGLAAAHGLAWMLVGFTVLAVLYARRSSVSFVPPRAAPIEPAVAGRDAHAALGHLLMQSVPATSVLRVAGKEWNRSAPLLARSTTRSLTQDDLTRLDHLAAADVAAEYRSLVTRLNPRLGPRSTNN